MADDANIREYREPEYNVNSLFLKRWSPRAMSGEEISEDELMSLFEAARWAPSSYNNQPWRFLYARRDTDYWELFFDLLVEFNRTQAKNAAALIVIISKKTFDDGRPSRTHSFDTGAAWLSLNLQGNLKGLIVHGMEGFDYDKAREVLNIPDEYHVEAMVAVGKPGNKGDLPQKLQEGEAPSDRKEIPDIAFEGRFEEKGGRK